MQRIHGIGYAKLRFEQRIDLRLVRQVGFDGNSFGTLGSSGFYNVGEDEMAVGCLWIFKERMGELNDVVHVRNEWYQQDMR